MKRTRVEISFEQRETWQLTRNYKTETQQCSRCDHPVPMIPAEQLASLAAVSTREIYKRIEEGELHFFENANRQVFVCLASFSDPKGRSEVKQNRFLTA